MAFDKRPVEPEKLDSLFSAAMWAPSANNSQPWRYIYVTTDHPRYAAVFELLAEGNKAWAKTAPVLAISIAQVISDYKDRRNFYAFYDTGMSVGNLLIQATHLGLFVHQMGGYDRDRARDVFGIPERFEPLAMMAIGYKGDPGLLDESIASRETEVRTRNKVSEHVFMGSWGGDQK